MSKNEDSSIQLFDSIKTGLINMDPVAWAEENLLLDGAPFKLRGNGYRPLVDIYRHIGIKSLERENSKPIVVVKGRQVGLSILTAVLSLYFTASGQFGVNGRPPMSIGHVFPYLELAAAFSKAKLSPIITGAKRSDFSKQNGKIKSVIEAKLDRSAASNDSLHFKQFENGNQLWIESIGINGNRVAGRSLSALFVDECQLARKAAIGNATKTLAQSKYGQRTKGVQVYFGTPLASGTNFWDMWMNSSQQYYYLGCTNCNEYFPLYTGDDLWEQRWLYGHIVKCGLCGYEQNRIEAAENGKWISSNKNPDVSFIGYHVSQILNPLYTKEDILNEKPDRSLNSEKTFRNEVLGEFYSGSSAIITPEEIYDKCADHNRKMSKEISRNDNKTVFIGFDWGQLTDSENKKESEENKSKATGRSYSCAVILSAENNYLLNIEYVHKFIRNDPESKMGVVEELYRKYSPKLMIGDVGYANDLSFNLQKMYGDLFLTSRACSSLKDHFKFDDSIFPKEIKFERDYLIKDVYDMMKRGNIKFPYGSYEYLAWFIDHICNGTELKSVTDKWGETTLRYCKSGSSPNDGMMALCNAILAHKYYISAGFKINNPNNMKNDFKKKNEVPIVLGYVPRL